MRDGVVATAKREQDTARYSQGKINSYKHISWALPGIGWTPHTSLLHVLSDAYLTGAANLHHALGEAACLRQPRAVK